MAADANDDMPPSPEGHDFNFVFQPGVDAEKDQYMGNDHNEIHEAQSEAHQSSSCGSLAPNTTDDGGDNGASDLASLSRQAGQAPLQTKKSPRRTDDDGSDDEESARYKKPRQSLFGGEMNDDVSMEQQGSFDRMIGEPTRVRLSSMNLEEKDPEAQHAPGFDPDLSTDFEGSPSPRPSPVPTEDNFMIPHEYNLRQNIDRKKAQTHYGDQDRSGEYDPAEEARQKVSRLQRAKAAKAAQKKGKKKSTEVIQRPCELCKMKCIARLCFEYFGGVRNYTDDKDQCPPGYVPIHRECELEMRKILDDSQEAPFFRQTSPGMDMQPPIEDPAGVVDDLTGHPAARGCRRCRQEGFNCDIVTGSSWPCRHCEDADETCELITRPDEKGRCKQCCENGTRVCSFETDPDQAICDTCVLNQLDCDYMPPRGYIPPRASINDIMYGSDRKHVQCTNCRAEGKRCSLKKKTDVPPCKNCKKNEIGCTFYDLPKVQKQKQPIPAPKLPGHPEATTLSSEFFTAEDLADLEDMDSGQDEVEQPRTESPAIEMEDANGNKGLVTKICTSFAHPIQFAGFFNDIEQCSFCEIPAFPFAGHYEKEVHVIEWYSRLGYTEIGGGHSEHQGTTSMCRTCFINRAQILECNVHEIVAFLEPDAVPAVDALLVSLLDAVDAGDKAAVRDQLRAWCSMCFTPASYECCRPQEPLLLPDDGSEAGPLAGCGLRLCVACAAALAEDFDGNSSDMAAMMDQLPKTREDDEEDTGRVARADVGFLSEDGLLARVMIHELTASEQ